MNKLGFPTLVGLLLPTLIVSSPALAQEEKAGLSQDPEYVEEEGVKDALLAEEDDGHPDGLDWRINAGATLNLADNRAVVGQTDGSTIAFGFKFDSAIDWRMEEHELRNNLAIAAGVSRTPVVPEFVKTQDNLELESIYLYHIVDWFGAFAKVGWQTPMFRGTYVNGEEADFQIRNADGTVRDTVTATRLTLTDSLKPSRFKQSLGLFAQPVSKERINVETRLGGGARETLADGQLALNDDDATEGVLEVDTLADVLQLRAEGAVEVWGSFSDKRVNYKLGAEVMIPFVNNLPAEDTRDALDLTNVLLKAGLSFKLVDWATLDYELRAVREPQLLDKWQVQNQLLLTLGFAAGSASPEPEE